MWLHLDLITRVVGITADIFPTVDYAYTSIPTYPSGDWIIQISKSMFDDDFCHKKIFMAQVRSGCWCAGGGGRA